MAKQLLFSNNETGEPLLFRVRAPPKSAFLKVFRSAGDAVRISAAGRNRLLVLATMTVGAADLLCSCAATNEQKSQDLAYE